MSLNINESQNVNTGFSLDVIPDRCNVGIDSLPVGIHSLPIEILKLILKENPDNLESRSKVCKLWNKTIKDMILHNELPIQGLSIFGSDAWEKFGFTIEGEVPRIPSRINQTTRSLHKKLAGENKALSFSAILMPKGLTLNKLIDLMKKKRLYLTCEQVVYPRNLEWEGKIVREFGDQPIKQSYWYLMTNRCVQGSYRHKKYKEQKKFLCEKSGFQFQCQPPTALEAISCCIMNKLKDGKHFLFCSKTRCKDKIYAPHTIYGDHWRHLIVRSPPKKRFLYLEIHNSCQSPGMAASLRL